MENFISTIVFTLPGLVCYYFLIWLGFTPSQKHNTFEMLGISALLWLPVSIMTIGSYNILSGLVYVSDFNNALGLQERIAFIVSTSQLQKNLESMWFLLLFILLSIVFSYTTARLWTQKYYHIFLKHINWIRTEKLNISKFSKKPTVWEEIFTSEGQKVVKIVKLDNPSNFIIGSIRKSSRPLEPDRNIALDEVDFFTKLIDKYSPSVQKVFVDTKAGIVVHLYDPASIVASQEIDMESTSPIISPFSTWEPEE